MTLVRLFWSFKGGISESDWFVGQIFLVYSFFGFAAQMEFLQKLSPNDPHVWWVLTNPQFQNTVGIAGAILYLWAFVALIVKRRRQGSLELKARREQKNNPNS